MTKMFLIVFAACAWASFQAGIDPRVSALAELPRAEAKWAASRSKSYEYRIDVRCMLCSARTPPRFRVVNGESALLDDVPSFTRDVYRSFGTVERLFASIRSSAQRGQHKVAVKYNVEYGYPEVVDLDPRREVFDDELYFRVTDFRVLQWSSLRAC